MSEFVCIADVGFCLVVRRSSGLRAVLKSSVLRSLLAMIVCATGCPRSFPSGDELGRTNLTCLVPDGNPADGVSVHD